MLFHHSRVCVRTPPNREEQEGKAYAELVARIFEESSAWLELALQIRSWSTA